MSNYTVYIHTFPNGKIYIGYLNLSSEFFNSKTFDEIMDNGEYYINRNELYDDIQKYKWENVTTEIISGLTKVQAVSKKKELCNKHQSYLPDLGYNRYTDVGLKQPPKIDKTPKGKFAKKIISMFLHNDFSVRDYVLNALESYSDENIADMLDNIKHYDGYIALSMTRKKFDSIYSEVHYLLAVIDDPYSIKRQPI